MKILITGSNGQLGKEIVRQLSYKFSNATIIKSDKTTLDISNYDSVNKFILFNKPNIVINCAAFTNVNLCESEVDLAYKVNTLGPKNLAISCEKINAKLVHISTDYVFDGKSNILYKEDDAKNPINVYGKSKLLGEEYVKVFCSKYFIIRTSWLYGDGDNFVKTMIKLSKSKKEINVVNDQFGSPTSTKDLSKCILNLMISENYGVYHGSNNGVCSWYDFAKKIFEIKRINVKINPITSKEFKSVVKRPSYSGLDNFMLRLIGLDNFRNWEDALIDYLL